MVRSLGLALSSSKRTLPIAAIASGEVLQRVAATTRPLTAVSPATIAIASPLRTVILRPFLYDETACASYLFGCLTHGRLAVVDPHEALVERYVAEAERAGAPIAAIFETHVQRRRAVEIALDEAADRCYR